MPVGDIDHVEKGKPLFPCQIRQRNFIERTPVGHFWFFRKVHSGLVWGESSFFAVTGCTATDNVFPGAFSSSGTRDDMIQAQITFGKFFPAVLAGIFIPGVDINPREADMANRHAVIGKQ
jgi:hypothetical protein